MTGSDPTLRRAVLPLRQRVHRGGDGAWVAIYFAGRYPGAIFGYVEGVFRWHNRAVGYASIFAIGEYRSFPLGP